MKRFWFIISIAAFLALESYCAYACAVQRVFNSLPASLIMFFALSAVCIPFSVILHELGHMLFGATVKIKAVPHFKLMGASSCTIIPKTDKNLKGRLIFTSLGGLIVNALCIALGIVALTVEAVPVHICALLPFSAYLFLLNAMPFGYSDGATDGLVVCGLIKGDDSSKVMLNGFKGSGAGFGRQAVRRGGRKSFVRPSPNSGGRYKFYFTYRIEIRVFQSQGR